MASFAALRKKAKEMGIGPSAIRSADTAEELQEVIDDFKAEGKKGKKGKNSKSGKTEKSGKKSGSKSKPAAKEKKSDKGKAKRSTAAKSKKKASSSDAGRHTLEGIDYTETDGWNPRDGSAPDRIVKALKKFRGNRDKVLDFLEDDVWDFVAKTTRDGEKRSKSEAINGPGGLKYRIARTDWEFAVRTGQHEPSENRIEYGTGENAKPKKTKKTAAKKADKPKGKKSKKTDEDAPKKRGRPKGSKNSTKEKKSEKKGKAGRPKGSKNKKK